MNTRIEHDTMGEIAVPAEHHWGAQTQRSLENFKIGGQRQPQEIITAFAYLKEACAQANADCGKLTAEQAGAIAAVCAEIRAGRWNDEFPLVVWQTGSGTQTNMNVNEVIACIMMNYIGMYLVNYLIKIAPIYDNVKNQTRPVPAAHRLPTAGLEKIFPDSSANIGIFIVIVVAIIVFILLEKTNFGFELKACGKNRDASIGFGVDAKRMIMTAMLISGALIGLGGALLYLSSAGKYIKVEDVQAAEGMNGIPVALLAMNHPIGIIFTGIFIAYMQVSGFYMQTYGFTTEIVDIIVSVIVYFSAFSFIIREGIRRWQLRQRTDVHHTGKGAEK